MLTLSIVRHAKSSWGEPALRDIDRPLNARGKSQAKLMGQYITDNDISPDLIICSTAKRARQTLKMLKKNWDTDAQILKESRLYLASTSTITRILEEFGQGHKHIMIIGHNPGLHMLAAKLAHTGDTQALKLLSERYPTSTLCVIKSDVNEWNKFDNGSGELVYFATPKLLSSHQI